MPVNPRLTSVLDRALSNKILSQRDIKRIQTEAGRDGVSPDEVDQIVQALAEAVGDGMELNTASRRRRLTELLDNLGTHHPTGLTAGEAPDGAKSYTEALLATSDGTTSDGTTSDLEELDLATPSFSGATIGVEDDGRITMDGATVALDLSQPSGAQIDAVMGLVAPGQLDPLDAAAKAALAANLLGAIESAWPIDGEGDHAFLTAVTTGTAAAALRQLGPELSPADVDRLLAAFETAPSPMVRSLLLDTLDKATLSGAQQQARAALETPEFSPDLLKAWDNMASGESLIRWTRVDGPVQQAALSGLLYCKKPASIENLFKGISEYKTFNDDVTTWDTEEVGLMTADLQAYTQKHGGLAYVFGTFEGDAPKLLAARQNTRLVAAMGPKLEGANPRLLDVKLTPDQASWMKGVLAGIKDDYSVERFAEALKEAALLASPVARGAGSPPLPREPMSPAAFELLQAVVVPHANGREATNDGMINVNAVVNEVRTSVNEIRALLQPRLEGLGHTPPVWGDFEVAPATRDLLQQIARDHIRSPMSVTNLDRTLSVIAAKHGGVVGAGADVFAKITADYMASWPDLQTFDFNKLQRIAAFAVEGKDVPLCSLNGQTIGLADFYGKVSSAVAASIDKSELRHPWMAERWGFRAKESVELLDVIAEKTARSEGPIVALRRQFPGKAIEVLATGLDGVHQQFLFAVKDGAQLLGLYNESSEGKVARYTDSRKEPVLFTAQVGDDGAFAVDVPRSNRVRRYPLQTTYGVGDSIDVQFKDADATEVRTEGEAFDTAYKIVEGHITGFDNAGNYRVTVKTPDGTEVEQTLTLDTIRKANHPHFFSESGSYLRDVEIDLKKDEPLRDFLAAADPIIEQFLPKDGSQAYMSAADLGQRQRKLVKALMNYCGEKINYPRDKDGATATEDKKYHELDELHRFPLGELAKIGRGVCRHQCIFYHLLLQRAGIDSRLASGSANTGSGNYRGLHLWVELTLANNQRFLSDQTWHDDAVPLWNGAYDTDKRRVEIYNRTSDFDRNLPT